jgi:hypothetical protein
MQLRGTHMFRTILLFGLIGAAVCGAFMVAGSLSWAGAGQAPPKDGAVVGYLTQLVALTVVFLGVKHHRDQVLGGVIRFLPAFGMGVGISAVATLGWVIGWEIVLSISEIDFGAMMADMMVEQARARGASEAEIEQAASQADAWATAYANPLVRMPISFIEMFPLGLVVSLISALLLRNRRFLPPHRAAAA